MTARVLVVDDDPDYRHLVRLSLSSHPLVASVEEAADGAEAPEAAARHRADVVLLDCSMPGADAFDALPAIRAAAPEARVILVSAHSATELRLAARATGAVGHLRKDTPARRLGDEVMALAGVVAEVTRILHQAGARLAGDRSGPRQARHFVTDQLESWALGDAMDAVALLVSEVVTNAVVHAHSEPEVSVRLTEDVVRVEVSDKSPVAPVPRMAGADDDSGRGLALLDVMARSWGVRPEPSGGKTVWFEVARPVRTAAGEA